MSSTSYILLFIIGLSAGSFLNVLSFRYEPGRRIFDRKVVGGRSRCSYCGKTLGASELIPLLSFLFQKGRCKSCRRRISFQYPLVETASGLIFVLVPLRLSGLYPFADPLILYVLSALWICVFLALLLAALIDFKHYIIPDQIVIFIGLLGLAAIPVSSGSFLRNYALLFYQSGNVAIDHSIGALFGLIFFGLIIAATAGRGMGWGDFKLGGAIGFLLGWPDIALALISAFLLGGIASLPLLAAKKKTMKGMMPFGPFMAAGVIIVFLGGHELLEWYFGIMGLV
ncbi:MAG: prepilin peptidase [Parcubacteria group bacterium]|nr:prepilin peptidase [Parcubacteria group bacterium]